MAPHSQRNSKSVLNDQEHLSKHLRSHLLIEAASHVPAHRHRGRSFKNKPRRFVRTNDKESNAQFSTGVFKFIKVVLQKKGHGVDG